MRSATPSVAAAARQESRISAPPSMRIKAARPSTPRARAPGSPRRCRCRAMSSPPRRRRARTSWAQSAACRCQKSGRVDARDEVLRALPLTQQRAIGVQPRQRRAVDRIRRREARHVRHAARRTWPSSAASAPGVTPATRAAAPKVAGRAVSSRSTISGRQAGNGGEVDDGSRSSAFVGAQRRRSRLPAARHRCA